MLTSSLCVVATGLRMLTSYLRVIYGKNQSVDNRKKFLTCQKFASLFTDPYECLRVVTRYLRMPASYLRMLAIDYD